jgi:hypothetical protein
MVISLPSLEGMAVEVGGRKERTVCFVSVQKKRATICPQPNRSFPLFAHHDFPHQTPHSNQKPTLQLSAVGCAKATPTPSATTQVISETRPLEGRQWVEAQQTGHTTP